MQVISSLVIVAALALSTFTIEPVNAGADAHRARHASFAAPHRRNHHQRLAAERDLHPEGVLGVRHGNRTMKRNGGRVFNLEDMYQGQNFFDGWDFFSDADPTHGTVNFLDRDAAFGSNLAAIRQDGTAIISVDDQTVLQPGQPRNSVRIQTTKKYDGGLFVIDLNAMPHGCSVWPAWWTVGDNWPHNGEIDIIEGVNEQPGNQMTLHTADGCNLDASPGGDTRSGAGNNAVAFSGNVLSTDCNAFANSNAGCAFADPDPQSYGHGLNTNRGGVWAMLWDDAGISIWHFQRSQIPPDLQNNGSDPNSVHPDPTTWPTPQAFWRSSLCPTGQFFQQHALVIDTTLCGDWAGSVYNLPGQGPNGGNCPATCADAVADPNNFKFAKWKINYIAVYN